MIKSVTWRIIGVALLGSISYQITGDWKQMTLITVYFHGIRFILYYFHERVWERVLWGKVMHPLAALPVNAKVAPEDMEIVKQKLKELGYID